MNETTLQESIYVPYFGLGNLIHADLLKRLGDGWTTKYNAIQAKEVDGRVRFGTDIYFIPDLILDNDDIKYLDTYINEKLGDAYKIYHPRPILHPSTFRQTFIARVILKSTAPYNKESMDSMWRIPCSSFFK